MNSIHRVDLQDGTLVGQTECPQWAQEFLSGLHALERDLPHFQLVRATDASPLEVYGDRYSSLAASPFDASDVLTHYTEAGQRAAGELLARHALYLS